MTDLENLGPYSRDCLELFDTLQLSEGALAAIATAPKRKFTAVPGVSFMGEAFPAGIKKREASQRIIARVANELYFLDNLLKKFPNHSISAPLFTYAVAFEGRPTGILTEDFTAGGTRSLTERHDYFSNPVTRAELPREGLYLDIFNSLGGRVYQEAFGHMLGFVFDREVLIDFDDVAYPTDEDQSRYKDLVNRMTVRIQ